MTMRDAYFIRNANELFDVAEEIMRSRGLVEHLPTCPKAEPQPQEAEEVLTPYGELQVKYDELKEYVTRIEQEQIRTKSDLRKSHEVIKSLETRLGEKPHWQSEVKTVLQSIVNVLQRLMVKL